MPDTTTANLGLTKIEVGASKDTWGAKLNDNMDDIDAAIKAADDAIVALNAAIGTKLATSGFTAAAILAALVTADGSGSGLDADMVDGVQGAALLQTANLLAAIQAVDGPGSGIDADLLDGNNANAFAAAAHNHDATYLAKAGGQMSGDIGRVGAGVYTYWVTTTLASGRMFLTVAGAGDPTSLPGDIWLTY